MMWHLGGSRRVRNTPTGCGNNLRSCFWGFTKYYVSWCVQRILIFSAGATSCRCTPKCYFQTDRMDQGIILGFRWVEGELIVVEKSYQSNVQGPAGWEGFHFSSWCIIGSFPFGWITIAYWSWNTLFWAPGNPGLLKAGGTAWLGLGEPSARSFNTRPLRNRVRTLIGKNSKGTRSRKAGM